jgi:hypothetical protein
MQKKDILNGRTVDKERGLSEDARAGFLDTTY